MLKLKCVWIQCVLVGKAAPPPSLFSPFSPTQLTWPVPVDQIALLQLLSSQATQEFRYYGGTTRVDFVGADGEPLHVDDDDITSVSNQSAADAMYSGIL